MTGYREIPKQTSRSEDRQRYSADSFSSASTTSLIFARIGERVMAKDAEAVNENTGAHSKASLQNLPTSAHYHGRMDEEYAYQFDSVQDEDQKIETSNLWKSSTSMSDNKLRRLMWTISVLLVGAWLFALINFLAQRHTFQESLVASDGSPRREFQHSTSNLKLDQILNGTWQVKKHDISWFQGVDNEDGLLIEQDAPGKAYLVVEDIRNDNENSQDAMASKILISSNNFTVEGKTLFPKYVFPSKDLKKVLIATNVKQNWRHSFSANYWIFDVETQTAQALDLSQPGSRIQLASWSPQSDAIVFTRNNNLFLRKLSSDTVIQITQDGGTNLFYGVPDWVYEEEVFEGNSATWWAEDGKYIAFLRTNESKVPEYPIQYFVSKPSGKQVPPNESNYPEVREIKYPKAGAPNPIVDVRFYDVAKGDVFEVSVEGSFNLDDLLITEIIWAGMSGKVLIRELNRDSDIMRVVLIDVIERTGKTVRLLDQKQKDGGWLEISKNTKFVPADPLRGRPEHGYIETVIHNNYDHIGYFTPLDNPTPIMLTSGDWEVVDAPSAVDLENNLVYFIGTKESSIQRHIYSVTLNGSDLKPLTDITQDGYYDVSFSSKAGYLLLGYDGPNIPWQKVISTPSNKIKYERVIEENLRLSDLAKMYELPVDIYSTVNIDGIDLNVVERRPAGFDASKKYPVLFYLYGGPGSQTVSKKFSIDFQAYIAASLGYIVVTVDGRGTGFIGRKARTIVRDNLGFYEAHDQIETAKLWAQKEYVDPSKMAVWGWSYGGFLTLKTLEQDSGQTFSYGMAVAPVTDWRYYDSIYTERYMHTPQRNLEGYKNSSISNVTALQKNVRFLILHGVADDNVHLQNTMILLDKLDLAGVENYDMHVFPDSDHSILFHNANRMVYHKLNNWLINAFNGEWLRTPNAVPISQQFLK
ncbi:BgTH12-01071 [Blumeria graminis f. sp. triticale]|uniref:dipeptidyl-peptidase IV n=4 Tax=Blumeria graminis TaxID=34373 RepID=A0A9X9MMZ6_BLUGR|nr:BgTH12-01071 [Blumeria graminis f. sp. triticale]VDB93716.1 Bgt-390 [Blumeria graminis f. sp. tritici]